MAAIHSSCSSLNVLFVCLIVLLLAAAHLPLHLLCTASFSTALMHRDHPESPLRNTTSTPARADYIHSVDFHNPNSPLITDNPIIILKSLGFPFVVDVTIGHLKRPLKLIFAFNDLLCVQCIPCECYKTTQHKFNTNKSPTFRKLHCEDHECRMANGRCDAHNNCAYTEELGLSNKGLVASTLGIDEIRIKTQRRKHSLNITFGCIYRTEGNFHQGSIGFMGLGPSRLSFLGQLGLLYQKVFSYCLPAITNGTSTLIFGSSANVPGTVSTPLDTSDNVYRVSVERIEIQGYGEHPIVPSSTKYVIDPYTRFIHVARNALDLIIEAVKKFTPFPPIIPGKIGTIHELCFNVATGRRDDLMPEITFFLENGAPFVLTVENAFEIVKEDVMCLTILSTEQSGGKSIIGSLAQLNKRIGIDITRKTLSFIKENC